MTNLDIANRFFDALVAGDAAVLDDLLAPEATFWTNHASVSLGREQFLLRFISIGSAIVNFRFENARRSRTPSGFVEQHTLRGTTGSGSSLAIHACLIGAVADGKITRLEEYSDSDQTRALAAAGSSS